MRDKLSRRQYRVARFKIHKLPVIGDPGTVVKKKTVIFNPEDGQHYRLVYDVPIPTGGSTEGSFKLAKHNT